MKRYKIKANQNKKTKQKFPYKILFPDAKKIPVPSQHDFSSAFIKRHGCSLAGFYMALRFRGTKKSVNWCYKYMKKNYSLDGHKKYSIRQVADAMNKITEGNPAAFYKNASQEKIKNALKNGNMVLFEEKNPIHTVVLLYNGNQIQRFSDGKYKKATVKQEINRRCKDAYYGGCLIIKKKK